MKKVLIALLAVCCLTFTSCFKESEYTITYTDDFAEMANLTAFEYDATSLVAKREIKMIQPNKMYELTSSDLATDVVIGVEAIVNGRIMEWYTADVFRLDPETTTHITVSFVNSNVQTTNPVNPDDIISRYLYK